MRPRTVSRDEQLAGTCLRADARRDIYGRADRTLAGLGGFTGMHPDCDADRPRGVAIVLLPGSGEDRQPTLYRGRCRMEDDVKAVALGADLGPTERGHDAANECAIPA